MNTLSRRIANFFAGIGTAGHWRQTTQPNPQESVMRDEIERQLIDREMRRQIF